MFVCDAPVVVGRAAGCRLRVALKERQRRRVDARRRNHVAGKGRARERTARNLRQRAGVVDGCRTSAHGFGEDSLSLQQRRDCGDGHASDRLRGPLVVGKEEQPALAERPAGSAAELLTPKSRFA